VVWGQGEAPGGGGMGQANTPTLANRTSSRINLAEPGSNQFL
jgi:hypothetical protein